MALIETYQDEFLQHLKTQTNIICYKSQNIEGLCENNKARSLEIDNTRLEVEREQNAYERDRFEYLKAMVEKYPENRADLFKCMARPVCSQSDANTQTDVDNEQTTTPDVIPVPIRSTVSTPKIVARSDTSYTTHLPVTNTHTDNTDQESIVSTSRDLHTRDSVSTGRTLNPQGPIVHTYDPDNLTRLVAVYNGITEATRKVPGASFSAIKNAANKCLIYKGYRWFFVDRTVASPNVAKQIKPTVISQDRRTGFVAMLNDDKTIVKAVYVNQKSAATETNQQSSTVCIAIKFGDAVKNHYWRYWDDLSDDLQEAFLTDYDLPVANPVNKGIVFQKINVDTNEVIETFRNMTEVVKKLHTSAKSIKQASVEGTPHLGFFWKACP